MSGKCLDIAQDTIRKTCTNGNQKIRFCDTVIGCLGTMHAYHTCISIFPAVKSTFTHQRICHRCLYFAYKLSELICRICTNDTAAHKNKWSDRMFDQSDNFLHRLFTDLIRLAFDRRRHLIFILSFCTGDILWNIHKNRSRTPCLSNRECTADGIRQLIHIFDNKIMFCHRHCNTGDIDFLKTIFAKKIDIDITGDCHHWN